MRISKDQLTDQMRLAMHREGPKQCYCQTVGGVRMPNAKCPAHPVPPTAMNGPQPPKPSIGMSIPPVASEPAREKPKKAAGLSKPRGRKGMNKTEAAFALILEAEKRAGLWQRYEREGLTLRWPDGMTYTSDFVAFAPESGSPMTFIETKGEFIEGDALVKFRAARAHWPEFHFKMMQLKKGSWEQIL